MPESFEAFEVFGLPAACRLIDGLAPREHIDRVGCLPYEPVRAP